MKEMIEAGLSYGELLDHLRKDLQLDLSVDALLAPLLPAIRATWNVDIGTGTWTWPGANTTSNLVTITHRIGRVPQIVVPTPNQDQGAGAGTLIAYSVSGKTVTQFSTRAGFQTFTPGAGVTATFDWLAIG